MPLLARYSLGIWCLGRCWTRAGEMAAGISGSLKCGGGRRFRVRVWPSLPEDASAADPPGNWPNAGCPPRGRRQREILFRPDIFKVLWEVRLVCKPSLIGPDSAERALSLALSF